MCGVYSALCLPRSVSAICVARRPSVFPSASTRYQRRSTSPGFAFQVFCIKSGELTVRRGGIVAARHGIPPRRRGSGGARTERRARPPHTGRRRPRRRVAPVTIEVERGADRGAREALNERRLDGAHQRAEVPALPAPVAEMSSSISIRTLTDGGQPALEVAHLVTEFLGAAKRSLDLAQYDFNLAPETAALVGGALKEAHARGVAVRILYNVDHPRPIPVPPPSEPDVALISSLGVPARAVAGVPDLMHHKFVVRDREAVLSGSTNWTDDSWSRQENVLVTVGSEELAHAFSLDFEDLWKDGDVERSGFVEPRPVEVDGLRVRPWFTPGFADALTHRLAKKIGHAQRVRICSPVITSAPVLATLAQRIADGHADIAGCVDATQVDEVIHQWQVDGNVSWKLPLLHHATAR